jgi:hypothetical protein
MRRIDSRRAISEVAEGTMAIIDRTAKGFKPG